MIEPNERERLFAAIEAHFASHREHGSWRKVGRCIYCSCGQRLGQGDVPPEMAACPEPLPESVLCVCGQYRTRSEVLMAEHRRVCRGPVITEPRAGLTYQQDSA
jgi:hypothetical protein